MQSQTRSRAHEVVDALSDLSERAKPGERLGNKDELRQRFGTSVGTFNEGLKIAQDRGLVEVRRGPGGGIFAVARTVLGRLGDELLTLDVSDPSVAEALRMRNALEPLVISDALEHATMADITRLRSCVELMEGAITAGDLPGFVHAVMDHQRHMVSVSPNAMLRPVFTTLLDILERDAAPVSSTGGAVTEAGLRRRLEYVIKMTDAMESRDRQAAYTAMVESTVGWRPYLPQEPHHAD